MKRMFTIFLVLSLTLILNAGFAQASITESTKLTASSGTAGDRFGYSVAISGDTAVIGAWGYQGWSGAAYVFTRSGDIWSQKAKLTASNGADDDYFGYSVAISGDTIVVGAVGNDGWTGSAYVFEKPETGWEDMTETSNLTASDGGSYDYFGGSVAISGDTIVIGAEGNDGWTGSAYVFEKPETGWVSMIETADLTASNGESYDYFGGFVAISGDTIVVGAEGNDGWTGSVYVFEKPETGWVNMIETANLTASDGGSYDYFGGSVAISGDTIVIGASNESDNGRAYIFEKPETRWVNMIETAKLTASDGAVGDRFGYSVAISGDTAVVGAFGDDNNGESSGCAYVFDKPKTTIGWVSMIETANLTASDSAADDRFGISIAISSDTVLVGAVGDDGWTGSAYVYQLVPEPRVMIENLSDEVQTIEGLPENIENGLLAVLDTTMKAIEDSNPQNDVAAINTLKAFINKIKAQCGKKISEADADDLIAKAQEIIEALSGGT